MLTINHPINAHWQAVNERLVAKMISEFAYEQAFTIEPFVIQKEVDTINVVDEKQAVYMKQTVDTKQAVDVKQGIDTKQAADITDGFKLTISQSITYTFEGQRNIWGQININPSSLMRWEIPFEQIISSNSSNSSNMSASVSATQLLLDLKDRLQMSEDVIAEHLDDLYSTLLSDCCIADKKSRFDASTLANMALDKQQAFFDGHPKFAFNKGRRGWGMQDIQQYSPESEASFQLVWIAVHQKSVKQATNDAITWDELVSSAMSPSDFQQLKSQLATYSNPEQYTLIPVHPWQWDTIISRYFCAEIASHQLIYLGRLGDYFRAQLSLRTLTNVSNPKGYDIKLPLTVMNTSCYRGIPGRYILAGPKASDWMEERVTSDAFFIASHTEVLQEPASAYVDHATFNRLPHAPYRYHELLGVIWRESAQSKLQSNEHAILMAALMECDSQGNPLIMEYIKTSGLTIEAWLEIVFKVVVLPYYHLLCQYGTALIAHGQNVTIVMKDGIPKRILFKDFQGDMRFVDQDYPEQRDLDDAIKAVTARLPESLIIHDLQTGHFVTVLRFISPLLVPFGCTERRFYGVLGKVIQAYIDQHPEYAERYQIFDLFKPRIRRIGLNLAKFRHGTNQSQSRMLPDMDDYMDNPLYIARRETSNPPIQLLSNTVQLSNNTVQPSNNKETVV
ncbi:IucA/IucC family siderophore biosynthesis protein [Vibrio sp.]|nr:IucA/IucC family siderophore biosynthesis protein [Vibrio sp.]